MQTDTITDELQDFWRDLETTLTDRLEQDYDGRDDDPIMAAFLDEHRSLWPHIKADIAKDKRHERMLADAICLSSGNQHFDHIVRVWLRGDPYGDDPHRERPPF